MFHEENILDSHIALLRILIVQETFDSHPLNRQPPAARCVQGAIEQTTQAKVANLSCHVLVDEHIPGGHVPMDASFAR